MNLASSVCNILHDMIYSKQTNALLIVEYIYTQTYIQRNFCILAMYIEFKQHKIDFVED